MIKPATLLALSLALSPAALAQTVLDVQGAVNRALSSGPDVTTARANLTKAQADLRAKQNDPTALIADLTTSRQGAGLAAANLAGTKLSVLQTVLSQYAALYQSQAQADLSAAQVNLDARNVKIAQARLAAKNGTQLDVSKAQNTRESDRQTLANARAGLAVQEAQLVKTLGLPTGTNISIKAPPAPPKLGATLASLQGGLDARLPSVVQASQTAQTAQLQVNLSNNDYTPRRTLEDARVSLANAKRDLDAARRTAATTVRDAYRSAQDAQQRVALASQSLANNRTTLTQTQARFKSGTAAAVDVQSAQVAVKSADFALLQARLTLWNALASLSVASGRDVTGLTGGAG